MPAQFSSVASPSQEPRRSDLQDLVPLRTAIDALPPTLRGDHIRTSTATTWITRGIKSRNGDRIRLRALRLPAGWMTSHDWLLEFFEALTLAAVEADSGSLANIPLPASPDRRKAAAAV
jgi:hypothetical protein